MPPASAGRPPFEPTVPDGVDAVKHGLVKTVRRARRRMIRRTSRPCRPRSRESFKTQRFPSRSTRATAAHVSTLSARTNRYVSALISSGPGLWSEQGVGNASLRRSPPEFPLHCAARHLVLVSTLIVGPIGTGNDAADCDNRSTMPPRSSWVPRNGSVR